MKAAALMLVVGLACCLFGCPKASRATEYEIYAERSGAAMRTDEPNAKRYRDKNSEPFGSLEDCRRAATGERRFDVELGAGWALKCRPLDVPLPRVVVR